MTSKLKTLALGLFATLALSAMGASSASAHYVFTTATEPTAFTGEQIEGKNKFTIAGQSIECVTATFTGTQTGTEATELTIIPTYANCTYGAKIAHLTMNGCSYEFTGATQASGHGTVHVKCPAGKAIELHITNLSGSETCTLTIAEQTPGQGYSAVTTGNDVKLTMTMSGIVISTDGLALICKALATTNATYTGVITLRGYRDGLSHIAANQVSISVDS